VGDEVVVVRLRGAPEGGRRAVQGARPLRVRVGEHRRTLRALRLQSHGGHGRGTAHRPSNRALPSEGWRTIGTGPAPCPAVRPGGALGSPASAPS
jgi:hypothetical protein